MSCKFKQFSEFKRRRTPLKHADKKTTDHSGDGGEYLFTQKSGLRRNLQIINTEVASN